MAPAVNRAVTFLPCLRDITTSLSVSVLEMRLCYISQRPKRTRGFCDSPESGCTVSIQEDLQVGSTPHLELDPLERTCLKARSTASFRRGLMGGLPVSQDAALSPCLPPVLTWLLGEAPRRGQVP